MAYTKNPQGRLRQRGIVELVNFELDPELHQWLKDFCRENGHSKRWVLTRALADYRAARTASDEED